MVCYEEEAYNTGKPQWSFINTGKPRRLPQKDTKRIRAKKVRRATEVLKSTRASTEHKTKLINNNCNSTPINNTDSTIIRLNTDSTINNTF